MAGRAEDHDAPDGAVEIQTPGVDASGVVTAGASDAQLWRSGKITKQEFLERTVQRATAHLEGHVEAPRLAEMRELLMSQLEHDPHLTDLVGATLGGELG